MPLRTAVGGPHQAQPATPGCEAAECFTAKGAALDLNCLYSNLGSTHQSNVIGARLLPSLCLSFLIHEMGIIRVTTSWGGCED